MVRRKRKRKKGRRMKTRMNCVVTKRYGREARTLRKELRNGIVVEKW